MQGSIGRTSARTAPITEQQQREASLDKEVTQIKQEFHHYLPESRDIIGPVNSARRALVREAPPVEETAERAAKEHQCVSYHRSKQRHERQYCQETSNLWR